MDKIKCIRDKNYALIPIDKIEYISQEGWVHAGGCRRDINGATLMLLNSVFEEVETNK